MEKLYNKLGGVIDDAESNKGHVSKKDMQSLHNKAVVYYDKRKGILMGPVTDKGKARLEIVENMAHRLDKMIKTERSKKMMPKR